MSTGLLERLTAHRLLPVLEHVSRSYGVRKTLVLAGAGPRGFVARTVFVREVVRRGRWTEDATWDLLGPAERSDGAALPVMVARPAAPRDTAAAVRASVAACSERWDVDEAA